MSFDFFKAIVLGIVEGLTEFLPVSSTGHLLLVNQFLGNDPARKEFWDTFSVLIQFGAILALLSIYFGRLWRLALGFFTDPAARRFVIGVLIAFLPAAVIGALAHDFIKGVLFNVWIICFTLIVGGAILLWIDQLDLRPRYMDDWKASWLTNKKPYWMCEDSEIPFVRSPAFVHSIASLNFDQSASRNRYGCDTYL